MAELRRATDPARSAWNDLTSEITTEINKVTAIPAAEKKGNPWQVHPIMENMTPEQRERFMSGGELPPAIAEEMSKMTLAQAGGTQNSEGEVGTLDYPMPNTEMAFQPAPRQLPPMEDLEYPAPASSNGHSEPPAL